MDLEEIPKGSIWQYKGQPYKIIEVHKNRKSQDSMGQWVMTVEYENQPQLVSTYFRAITDFTSKFRRLI